MPKLYAHMNEKNIGFFEKKKDGSLYFQYSEPWVKGGTGIAISLSLPLSTKPYSGEVVENYLENLLPNNPDTLDKIKAAFQVKTSSAFDILTAIGSDCVGAVQLTDRETPSPILNKVTALSDNDIERILKDVRLNNKLGMNKEDSDKGFRLSIAGVQRKTALTFKDGEWGMPIGTTPTTHIFKLPMGKLQHSNIDLEESCENEWLCLVILRNSGFNVANAEIKRFGSEKALIVERFDRRYDPVNKIFRRLSQEDMCQVLGIPSHKKYECDCRGDEPRPDIKTISKIFDNSFKTFSTEPDTHSFFKTQVAFWVLAAIDGHGKNFSVQHGIGGRYRMTPLYDVMSAHPFINKSQLQYQDVKLAMSLRGTSKKQYKLQWMKYEHFINTGLDIGLSKVVSHELTDEAISSLRDGIDKVSSNFYKEIPSHIFDKIINGTLKEIERLELSRDFYLKH